MMDVLKDKRIRQILSVSDDDDWKNDLKRFEQGDVTLDRKSAGESSIKAIQRLLIFLGYSTRSNGAFSIDGDFGRGTNRGVAHFQFEHGLKRNLTRDTLCYDCTWQNASRRITSIPDTKLTIKTLKKMVETAVAMIDAKQVMCGDFKAALLHLNGVHNRRFLSCKQIVQQYGKFVDKAVKRTKQEQDIDIQPEWILTVIKQETSGIIRPRFEQQYLTRLNRDEAQEDFSELRFRSMSLGLGQIMGNNYKRVGASSARELYTSPVADQVLFVARFLTPKAEVLSKTNPSEVDFRKIARFYNGSGYEAHHYHEGIAHWFREFRMPTRA